MPNNTADQQIPIPAPADLANNPSAMTSMVAPIESRLVRRYTTAADQAARDLAPVANQISGQADTGRIQVYDGAALISLYSRSLFANLRKTASQNVGPSNTVLQNITDMVVALPAANGAIFGFSAVVYYDAATAADLALAFTIPAGATMRWGLIGAGLSTIGDPTFSAVATASGTIIAVGGNGVGTVLMTIIKGELTQGANAGNLQLQAAQNSSDASNTTVQSRSRMKVWRSL